MNSSKGQFKIQQMAFVLVALMIFFAMAAVFYFSIRSAGLEGEVERLREEEVLELVRKMSGTPEFAWTVGECASCVDMDKVFVLSESEDYEGFWRRTEFLQLKRVYPSFSGVECTRGNYPDCDTITVLDSDDSFTSHSTFVSLCRFDNEIDFTRCEVGKMIVGFERVNG